MPGRQTQNPVLGYELLQASTGSHAVMKRYHGLSRAPHALAIPHDESLPEHKLWIEGISLQSEDGRGDFEELETATRFQREFRSLGYPFDLVEVWGCDESANALEAMRCPGFLGFDVVGAAPDSSALCYHKTSVTWDFPDDYQALEAPREAIPIWLLMNRYFKKLINPFGLLDGFENANLLKRLLESLSVIFPGLGEAEGPEVLGVVAILPTKEDLNLRLESL